MSEQNFIGCDPGDKGGFCLLRVYTDKEPEIHFLDGTATRKEMITWFTQIKQHGVIVRMALLEDVKSIFGVSAAANFGFGRSVERAHFVLEIQQFGLAFATPKVWQKAVGVVIPKKKKVPIVEGEPKPKKPIGNNILIKKRSRTSMQPTISRL